MRNNINNINNVNLSYSDYLIHYNNHHAASLWRYIEINYVRNILNNYYSTFNFKKSMDFGCGDGFLSSDLFKNLDVGLEINPIFKNNLYKNNIFNELVITNILNFNFNHKFNFIYSNSVLEHIENIDDVLLKIFDILEFDGLFIFTSPNKNFNKFNFTYNNLLLKIFNPIYYKLKNNFFDHFNILSNLEWNNKMKKFGFKHLHSFDHISFDVAQQIDLYTLKNFFSRKFKREIFSLSSIDYNLINEMNNFEGINTLHIFTK